MAFIKIPEGKTEVQIGGNWVKIPAGAKEMEIPDDLLSQGAQQGNSDWAAQGYRPAEFKNETQAANYTPQAAAEILKHIGNGANTQIAAENSMRRDAQSKEADDKLYRDEYINRVIEPEHKLHRDVAKAQSQSFFKKLTGDEKDAKEVAEDLDYIAKNAGYELGAVQTDDGRVFFGAQAPDGRIIQKEVTPDTFDRLAANKGEIIGGVVGGGLAPFTGGASLVPMLAMSAGGSAIGSMNDLRQKGEAVGREYSAGDYASRALQAAGEDALGGVAVAGAGKLVKAAAPAIKQAGEKVIEPVMEYGGKAVDLAKRATDWGGIGIAKESLKGLPMANAGGAKRAISAIVGDEADEILKNAEKLGGYKVDNNNFTDLQILNKPINFIKDHLANTAGKLKLDKASDFLNNAQGVNKVQREIVDFALGDNKATSNVINALQGDKTGQAARNLAALAQSDVNAVRKILPNMPKGEISRDVSNFYARVSDDFGKMESEIAQNLGGKTTTLSGEAIRDAKEAMMKNLNAFELKTPEAKTLLGALENLKDRPMDFSQLRKIKKDFNEYAKRVFNKDGHYGQKVDTSAVGKIIDDAVDRLIEGTPNAKYLKSELAKYSDMSKIKGNPFFEKIIDPNSSADDVLSAIFNADKAQGDILDKFSRQLNPAELEKFETDLLGELFNSQIAKRGTRNITEVLDGIGLRENLQKINLKSEAGKDLKDAMLQLANARGNLVDVFATIDKNFIKPTMPRAGIAQTGEGMLRAIIINRLKQSVFKYIGKVGDDAALDYHLREGLKALKVNEGLSSFMQAVKNSGASDEVAEGIAKAVIDQGREIAAKNAAKEAQNAVKAKFSPEELKKALIDPSLTAQEKIDLVEMAKRQIKEELDEKASKTAKGELVKQGEGFTVKDGGKPYQYARQTFKPEQWINDLSGILTDEWAANLKSLAVKHPEMFKSEADVFRVIKEIKNNPTRFFANNNEGNALILKDLDSDKVGEIAVRKSDGQIVHTTKNDKSRRLEQLGNRQKRILGNTELENSDRSARLSRHSDTSRTMATADNAGSVANKTIIPQNSQKVKELSPAELRKAIINAKDDKERLAIIENQKAGIRQRLKEESANERVTTQGAKNIKAPEKSKILNEMFFEKSAKWSTSPRKDAAYKILREAYAPPVGVKDPELILPRLKYAGEMAGYDEKQTGLRFLKQTEQILNQKEMDAFLKNDAFMGRLDVHRKILEQANDITPIKQFGTNYAEFYHDGQGAMKKLLTERKGQVAGAFYRKDLGDIDLIWGEAKQNAKGGWDGYGLAKIEKKHPEITAQILDDVIKNGELEKTHNGYNVKSGRYVIGLNRGWNENGVKIWDNKWIVTAFDDSKEKAISKAPVDSFDGRNAASANSTGIIPQNLKNASIGEWQREISKVKDDWSGLKRLMDQIKHSETLKQNERANLYVNISDRMKELREARK